MLNSVSVSVVLDTIFGKIHQEVIVPAPGALRVLLRDSQANNKLKEVLLSIYLFYQLDTPLFHKRQLTASLWINLATLHT